MGPIRVLCVDDHAIVRQGLAAVLSRQRDITVVASASNGEDAIKQFRAHQPDITLMDLQLPTMSGLQTIREIRHVYPEAKIIVLTMYEGDEDIYRALEAGAITYLLKDTLCDELINVIRSVRAGERPLPSGIRARLQERLAQQSLTPREVQVLQLISRGMRNKEIATALGITEDTTHSHLKNIFTKLQVQERTAAVRVGVRRGIIHLE